MASSTERDQFVLVNLNLDDDVLEVSLLIIFILDCIAETDGWGESSLIFTGRKFIDLLGMLLTPGGGGAVSSLGLPSSRHVYTLVGGVRF